MLNFIEEGYQPKKKMSGKKTIETKKVFITSDLHIGHKILSEARGFEDVEEHDNFIINRILEIPSYSTLFILGDVFYKAHNKIKENFSRLLDENRINSFIIKGNHDKYIENFFFNVLGDTESIFINEKRIFLSHYPHLIWDCSHYNSWNLFGHIHLNSHYSPITIGKQMNVNLEFNDYNPYSFGEVENIMSKKNNNVDMIKNNNFL